MVKRSQKKRHENVEGFFRRQTVHGHYTIHETKGEYNNILVYCDLALDPMCAPVHITTVMMILQ